MSNEELNTAIELLNDKEALNKITKEGAKKGEKNYKQLQKLIQKEEYEKAINVYERDSGNILIIKSTGNRKL